MTFRYFDALCGNIKFSPSKVSIEDTVWRDTKEDENLTTFQEVDELIEPIDPAIEETETEVEIDNQSLPHHQKRKENPLFDFFSGLSTDVLTRSSSGKV